MVIHRMEMHVDEYNLYFGEGRYIKLVAHYNIYIYLIMSIKILPPEIISYILDKLQPHYVCRCLMSSRIFNVYNDRQIEKLRGAISSQYFKFSIYSEYNTNRYLPMCTLKLY